MSTRQQAATALLPAFEEARAAFLEHLELERNGSTHTVRAYAGDLASLFDHAMRLGAQEEQSQGAPPICGTADGFTVSA